MKEIKYRAWDKLNDRMWKVWQIDTILNKISIGYSADKSFWIENYELMQYIGITDGKGVEIYEGDILKIRDGEFEFVGTVQYSSINCGYLAYSQTHSNGVPITGPRTEVEILGNIFENA